ncbi:hypothetical protein AVEN_27355-1 [Araneus ventricosus]|uniref:Uncharacterized protein n=1 Tax=Araneus ventricosus TaxID=182803 RepID=A0A4Y2IPB8_ARAVE|nr:hypothetical protein AVEN_27355-1 [Araneus ventricosus]
MTRISPSGRECNTCRSFIHINGLVVLQFSTVPEIHVRQHQLHDGRTYPSPTTTSLRFFSSMCSNILQKTGDLGLKWPNHANVGLSQLRRNRMPLPEIISTWLSKARCNR